MNEIRHRVGKGGASGGSGIAGSPGSAYDPSKQRRVKSAPLLLPAGLLLLMLLPAVVVTLSRVDLPTPLSASLDVREFSEERAMGLLKEFVSIGPRVEGTAAANLNSTAWMLSHLRKLAAEAAERPDGPQLEVELQHTSGSFSVNYRGFLPILNAYTMIPNVVLRLSTTQQSRENALLLSSHYDTMPQSPGASDAGSGVVVVLETVRALLSMSSEELDMKHALVVVLNGCEEMGLQAAHGFMDHHRWAGSIRALVNLDAGGVGGKAALVQTGPKHAWLADLYRSAAPYPTGNVVGQDLFQSGAVPSDTDFRVYSEFVPGLDMVFYTNGFIYHTDHDTVANLPPGSLQHMGGNTLAVVRQLLRQEALPPADAAMVQQRAVYFDLLGRWMFSLPADAALSLYRATALVLLALTVVSTPLTALRGLLVAIVSCLLSVVLAVLAPLAVGVLFVFVLRQPMAWYNLPALVIPLQVAPACAGVLAAVLRLPLRSDGSRTDEELLGYLGAAWTLAGLMAAAAAAGLGATFAPWLLLVGILLALLLRSAVLRCIARPAAPPAWLSLLTAAVMIVPCALPVIDLAEGLIDFFLPAMGRFGMLPADIVLAVVLGIFSALLLMPLMGPLHRRDMARWRRVGLLSLAATWLLTVAMVAARGLPYDLKHPKRVMMQHTWRFIGDSPLPAVSAGQPAPAAMAAQHGDSYVHVMSVDNLLLEDVLPQDSPLWADEIARGPPFLPHDTDALYPLIDSVVSQSLSLRAQPPTVSTPYIETKSQQLPNGRRNLTVIAHAQQATLLTLVFKHAQLRRWSLSDVQYADGDDLPEELFVRQVGDPEHPWQFWMELADDEPVVVAYGATYFAPSEAQLSIVDALPDWCSSVLWTSVISEWTV